LQFLHFTIIFNEIMNKLTKEEDFKSFKGKLMQKLKEKALKKS